MMNIELVRRAIKQLYPDKGTKINQIAVSKHANSHCGNSVTRIQQDGAMQALRKRGVVVFKHGAWYTTGNDAALKKPPVPNTAAENVRLQDRITELLEESESFESNLSAAHDEMLSAQTQRDAWKKQAKADHGIIRNMRADLEELAKSKERQYDDLMVRFAEHVLGIEPPRYAVKQDPGSVTVFVNKSIG